MASAAPQGMIARIKGILLSPKEEWRKIDSDPMSSNAILMGWVLPLAAIPPLAGLIGMMTIGLNWMGVVATPATNYIIATAVVQYVLSIVMVFVIAAIVNALAPSFSGQKDSTQALKVVAFSMTASWLGGIFSLVPMLGILGLLMSLYGLYILYVGLPMLMRVPANKETGYFIVMLIVAIVASMVIGLVAGSIVAMIAPPFATPLAFPA